MPGIKTDAMITRLEKEVEERSALIEGVAASAQDQERDLTANENELMISARSRIEECNTQLLTLRDTRQVATAARKNVAAVSRELDQLRTSVDGGATEYRSAGAYLVDAIQAHQGSRAAQERMEMFQRDAAHQITTDNAGLLPSPLLGEVINFIDAARPLVGAIGVQTLTTSPFRRPRVTQHTLVGKQGTNGLAADQKTELDSQKMTIVADTINAVTYGGYVNVARQNIDWTSPNIMDIIVNDLAAQYAIETEEATADALAATNAADQPYPLDPTGDELSAAIWAAAATVWAAVKGQGQLVLAIAPNRLADFGPLFAPYGPTNAQGTGFNAANFGQGLMGSINGVPVYMSAGLDSGEAFLFSTAAVECWEQRIGTLSVVEPSVLGVQVAYAGYFAVNVHTANGNVPLVEGTA